MSAIRQGLIFLCGALTTGLPMLAGGSGFSIPEQSIAGIGLSNAMVANTTDLGGLIYNPAAMSFHPGTNLSLGLMGIKTDLSVKTASGNHDNQGQDSFAVPLMYGSYQFAPDWTLGLGIGAPYGLETQWDLGTFPKLSQPTTAPLHPTLGKLELIAISPSLAYKINDSLSLAAGLDYYRARSLNMNTTAVDIDGTGDAYGFNLGALYKYNQWSLGLSYHSPTSLTAEGKFQPKLAVIPGIPAGTHIPAEANLDLPWRLQAGVRYQANQQLGVEFDITRTGWSTFDRIVVQARGLLPSGTVLTTSTNEWHDSSAYRLGVNYRLMPGFQLRFGYTYDEAPQGNEYFSARIPDADRQLFSIGLDQDLGSGWGIEAGYMYVLFEDRNYKGSVPFGAHGREPNGTDAYKGDYKADVHLLGLGVRKTF